MAYITKDDLLKQLSLEDINTVQRSDDTGSPDLLLNEAIADAEAYIKAVIGNLFDLTIEFAKTGSARSRILVNIGCHLAIWVLCTSFITVQASNEDKKYVLYKDALSFLDKIKDGLLDAGLTKLDPETPVTIAYGVCDNLEITY